MVAERAIRRRTIVDITKLHNPGPERAAAALEQKTAVWSDENADQRQTETPESSQPLVRCHIQGVRRVPPSLEIRWEVEGYKAPMGCAGRLGIAELTRVPQQPRKPHIFWLGTSTICSETSSNPAKLLGTRMWC